MGSPPQQPERGQGDVALTRGDWFPRPASEIDVELLDSSDDFDARTLFRLLTAEDAREWRHKVGVAGRTDGSGKSSTRILASSGFVLKTNLDALSTSAEQLRARLLAERARGMGARVWHRSRRIALMRSQDGWLPVTACRELRTLRDLEDQDARLRAWTAMIGLGIEVHARVNLGLDLNPANFAVEVADANGPLFYIDDELYPTLDVQRVAFAIAARLPEEPSTALDTWTRWGEALGAMLDARDAIGYGRVEIAEAISGYPLTTSFHAAREALIGGLLEERPTLRMGMRSFARGDRVCIIADVHANLPALEATLEAARAAGATQYLFLGDAVGYGPHPRECVARLADLQGVFIGGNHDHAIATGRFELGMNRLARACAQWTRSQLGPAEIEWLLALPREHRDEEWLAVHGAPRDPQRFLAYVYDLTFEENLDHMAKEGITACFCGHTHVQLVHAVLPSGPAKLRDGVELTPRRPCLVNPGSVGQPRDRDPRAAFAIWDRASGRVTFGRAAYDIERTLAAVRAASLPAELLTRLAEGT